MSAASTFDPYTKMPLPFSACQQQNLGKTEHQPILLLKIPETNQKQRVFLELLE